MSRAPLAPSGEERVAERSMDCGQKPASALPEPTILAATPTSHPAYFERLADAVERIKRGERADAIRQRHGSIVLRDALRVGGVS